MCAAIVYKCLYKRLVTQIIYVLSFNLKRFTVWSKANL